MGQKWNQLLLTILIPALIHFTESQVDTTGCSSTPLTCFDPARAINLCNSDADCPSGKTCCYKSCYKKCVPRSPCSNVVCKSGYLCQVVNTQCTGFNCQEEASCLPQDQVNCPLQSTYGTCPAGYERSKDMFGCRTGPCQPKRACPPSCKISCAYGVMEDFNGCPLCRCKPAPANPCSSLGCSFTQECRFIEQSITTPNNLAPVLPQPGCVPNTLIPSVIDKSCSMRDPTTTGLPVLDRAAREIDCRVSPCPAHSVCVVFNPSMHRCCWQHSQVTVTTGPKVGECPPSPMLRYGVDTQICEIDANCPGTFKCCYINKARGRTSWVGLCLPPIHFTLSDNQLCQRNDGTLWFYMVMGVC